MVDRKRRDRYAELLRHFLAGRITNDDYERRADQIMASDSGTEDRAIAEVYQRVWFLYCDIRTHRMSGKWALPPEGRREAARWIMFLYGPLEYEWPPLITLSGCLANLVTLTLWGRIQRALHKREFQGDIDLWPFYRRADYEEALKHPRLLAGDT